MFTFWWTSSIVMIVLFCLNCFALTFARFAEKEAMYDVCYVTGAIFAIGIVFCELMTGVCL